MRIINTVSDFAKPISFRAELKGRLTIGPLIKYHRLIVWSKLRIIVTFIINCSELDFHEQGETAFTL